MDYVSVGLKFVGLFLVFGGGYGIAQGRTPVSIGAISVGAFIVMVAN